MRLMCPPHSQIRATSCHRSFLDGFYSACDFANLRNSHWPAEHQQNCFPVPHDATDLQVNSDEQIHAIFLLDMMIRFSFSIPSKNHGSNAAALLLTVKTSTCSAHVTDTEDEAGALQRGCWDQIPECFFNLNNRHSFPYTHKMLHKKKSMNSIYKHQTQGNITQTPDKR